MASAMGKVPAVEQQYYYRAAPARVFRALTRRAELEKWFAGTAEVDGREGGVYRLRWSATAAMNGRVREFVVGRRLSVDWRDRVAGRAYNTRVTFELRRKGKGTVLRVRHSGLKSGKRWVRFYGEVQAGWAFFLLNLRSVLEHGTDLRDPSDVG
ncbi:MAG TPA: SRPBCC domain-containing protein [Thermoplasmata archaeon]|nr:SRPBCC domain-containing protein [Thermoplasmata archaeon]